MAQPSIWPGSGSAASGSTPFGFYDNESTFQTDAPNFAIWAGKRLGYPIMDVELQDSHFYACFEESIAEYSSQVNQFNIVDNLMTLQGQSTGSEYTHRNINPSMGRVVELAQEYGTEASIPVGGEVTLKSGSIDIVSGSQVYDLNTLWANVSESSNAIEIRRVHHGNTPAIQRFFDPYATTGYGTQNLISGFGFGRMSPAVSYTMMPIFEDMLRMQAIELNDTIRKSAYGFHIVDNKMRIFPNPSGETFKVYFDYYVKNDKTTSIPSGSGAGLGVVSDFSNAPYGNMKYGEINDTSKTWIRKYGLALCKELLGHVRGKYASIPIPNSETTLDGETLRSEATADKEMLITQLREMLEQTSKRALLEKDRDEGEFLSDKLGRIPISPIFIG